MNNNLPQGFQSIDEAVALIKSDTRENSVVDMDWLISRKKWIETGNNFRIPKVRRLKPSEVRRSRRGKLIEYETTGVVNVQITNNFDKELLLKTINEKYQELVGHEYREVLTRAVSTVADDAQGREAVRPRANKPIAKEGANIGEGTVSTSNGDFAV